MVGPGDEGAAGRSHLRASHADREQVIDVLKAAFAQGRLAKDDFDLRVGQVLASRTYGGLDALTADLPPCRRKPGRWIPPGNRMASPPPRSRPRARYSESSRP
jgi:hypothetical protein